MVRGRMPLLGFICDIHRIFWFSVDPVDVRNEPQQGICPQAICSSSFLNLGSDFGPFWKNLTCKILALFVEMHPNYCACAVIHSPISSYSHSNLSWRKRLYNLVPVILHEPLNYRWLFVRKEIWQLELFSFGFELLRYYVKNVVFTTRLQLQPFWVILEKPILSFQSGNMYVW